MYATERQQRIAAEARQAGRVEVATLADLLGVTTETIRRDLTALERRGTVRRVHGGALPVERLDAEPTVGHRAQRLTAEKRRIARRALQEIPARGTVLFDAGTTTMAVVELLPADFTGTVLTNSLPAAAALVERPDVTLFVIGGRVRGRTGAAVGQWAADALKDVSVDVAFIGTNGFSAARGLTTPDQSEALVKRAMVAAARRVVVVSDSTKSGDDHLHRFAHLEDVHLLVTDDQLPDEVASELRDAGVEVVCA